ncbi:OFA family MFS transporter [Cytobacillus sp. Sa5YUA1]|uniref:OFA family MFS transporter n=1 Tax=Cytobacillus stercorigallinarum TaxID=2762240 RepID=A0ABR8QKC5_9BACI|nr:OFA family MFS transporter [Cytobacillus stercorigallinarum]MBD7935976.1 OFA family MFS transporter [Cytobacillus stercorigallinarum]
MSTSKKAPNRWFIFTSAWIIIFLVASIAIFSVFSEPMTNLHGWSSADYNLAYSLYTLIFAIVAIFAGMITDRYGVKWLMYIGGLLFGLGWFLTASVTTIPMLYVAFSLIAGSGAGMMYNSALVTAMRWFPDKGGKISGLLLSSAAIGPFILSPIAAIIIEHFGVLVSFRILGIVFFIGVWAVGWLMYTAPANFRPKGWTSPLEEEQSQTKKATILNLNWKQMLATPLFYLLFLTLVAASTAGTMMVSSASVIAQDQVGLTATVGAVIVSISTLSNFVGRLAFGVIYDKFGSYTALIINLVMTIAALLLLTMATSLVYFTICIIILGFAFGGLLVVFPPLTSQSFGPKNFGMNYAIVFLGYSGGAFVGPRIASYFKETTGSFTTAYVAAAILTAIGIGLVGLVLFLNKKNQQEIL